MLFDGAGSERFVRWLDEVGRGARAASELPEESRRARLRGAGAQARGEQALRWRARMNSFAARSPRSLAGPLARTRQRLGLRARDVQRRRDGADRRARASSSRASSRPMLFYLAASVRAHHAVFARARRRPAQLRGAAAGEPARQGRSRARSSARASRCSGSRSSPSSCDDFERLLARAEGAAARRRSRTGWSRRAPPRWTSRAGCRSRVYARMARRAFGGELCSFFFAYTDEFLPGMTTLSSARRSGTPSTRRRCRRRRAASAIFSLRDGRLNFTHVRQAGVFARRRARALPRARCAPTCSETAR